MSESLPMTFQYMKYIFDHLMFKIKFWNIIYNFEPKRSYGPHCLISIDRTPLFNFDRHDEDVLNSMYNEAHLIIWHSVSNTCITVDIEYHHSTSRGLGNSYKQICHWLIELPAESPVWPGLGHKMTTHFLLWSEYHY